MRIAMMAMTTSNSMSVNPRRRMDESSQIPGRASFYPQGGGLNAAEM
jgi:hypothetical protein